MTQILLRRGTSAEWASADTVLGPGEPGFDLTTKVLKIGDGVTAWSALTETADDDTEAALNSKAPLASPTFTGTTQHANTYKTGSTREDYAYVNTNVTLSVDSPHLILCIANGGGFTVTPPSTSVPNIRFKVLRYSSGSAPNVDNVTIAGQFQNRSGDITNLMLYAPGQWHEFMTSSTPGLFVPLGSSPVLVPAGTPHAGIPDNTLFVEYTP